MTTADEHRVALAMLRIALELTPEQVEEITGGDPGWVVPWESGGGAAVSLERWQGWVRTLAIAYSAKLHARAVMSAYAHADAAALLDLADSLVELAEKKARQ